MLLDLRTLSAIAAITSGLVAASLVLVLRSQSLLVREALRTWTFGIALQVAGWFLAGLRGGLPAGVSVVMANVAISAGVAECVHALRLFHGPSRRLRTPWIAVTAVFVVSVVFTYLAPDRAARMGLNSALIGAVMGIAAWAALRASPDASAVPPSHWLVAATFFVGAGVLSFRVLVILLTGYAPPFEDLRVPVWQVLLYASMAYVPVLATLGYALMCNDVLNRELARLASRDPLTGILNRRSLEERSEGMLASARRRGRAVSVALIDVDHFKSVNDTFGHEAGDESLRQLVRVLQRTSRAGDLQARWGGEEFLVVMPETEAAAAQIAAERIRAEVEALEFRQDERLIPLRVSIGVAQRLPGEDLSGLVRRADAALYEAKRLGRNRVAVAADLPAS